MSKYQLIISKEADHDLDNLYVDGFNRWGEEQADRYYDGLLSLFDNLCENPYLYRAVDEIRPGYRRGVHGKHSIFYRVVGSTVEAIDGVTALPMETSSQKKGGAPATGKDPAPFY